MTDVTEIIQKQIKKYGRGRGALMPILQSIVEEKNYLSEEDIIEIARVLDISSAEIYGTASFYSLLDIEERGKYVVRLCKTIVCDMKSGNDIVQAIENTLKIKMGETTSDKKFTLLSTNCLGWCHKGPAMLVNNEVYTELIPQKAVEIIESYINH